MKVYQEVLKLPAGSGGKIGCTDITPEIQDIIVRSGFIQGVVLVHTLHTTTGLTRSNPAELVLQGGNLTGLTKSGEATSGYLVQEKEPLLLRDFAGVLDEGAEKFLQALPQIASGRERFLDFVPTGLLDTLLGFIIAILRPTKYFGHDDFSIRTENVNPNEKKNAIAHLKAAMIRESLLWSFRERKLNLGKWQNVLFWDFDPEGRSGRQIQVVVIGN
jgi:thiamine phosphate synthase YjbQ (UPF0047 family)